jgi:16S rRNA (uracil1498-N3)-methyltransferase
VQPAPRIRNAPTPQDTTSHRSQAGTRQIPPASAIAQRQGTSRARSRSAGRPAQPQIGPRGAGAKRSTQLPFGASATRPPPPRRLWQLGASVIGSAHADAKIRLYVDQPLARGKPCPVAGSGALPDRRDAPGPGGPPSCSSTGATANGGPTLAERQTRRLAVCEPRPGPCSLPPDLWLLFAPIKKARTDFIVEKAVEMGCRASCRCRPAHQFRPHPAGPPAGPCGRGRRTMRRDLCARGGGPATLDKLLAKWPEDRRLYWCDETAPGGRQPATW